MPLRPLGSLEEAFLLVPSWAFLSAVSAPWGGGNPDTEEARAQTGGGRQFLEPGLAQANHWLIAAISLICPAPNYQYVRQRKKRRDPWIPIGTPLEPFFNPMDKGHPSLTQT